MSGHLGSDFAAGVGDAVGDLFRFVAAIVIALYLGSFLIDYWLWVPLLLGVVIWAVPRMIQRMRERRRRAAEPCYLRPAPPGAVRRVPLPMVLHASRPTKPLTATSPTSDRQPVRPAANFPRTELHSATGGDTTLRDDSGSPSGGTATGSSVQWTGWIWRERGPGDASPSRGNE